MTQRILSGALIAGLAAGLLAALLNIWTLTPLILEAETFEGGHVHVHEDGTEHVHETEEAPAGLSRAFGTVATTLVAYAGFALVMGAGMAFAARRGVRIDARAGLLWGLAGFAAVQLAPAVGLPPELPGTEAAPLAARQVWWALCAVSTVGALAALAFGQSLAWSVLAVALLVLPHVLGAPQPPSHDGTVPPGLAAAFATRSLGVAALSWAALGALGGWLAGWRPVPRPA